MTTVVDAWRAADPEARLISGSVEALRRAVRGVVRTRAAAPHLPPRADGQLLIVDAAILREASADRLLAAIADAQLNPVAILIAGDAERLEPAAVEVPLLLSSRPATRLADALSAYFDDEAGFLARFGTDLRLAAAEAALADPLPGAAAGLVATRLRRGIAVSADGELLALNPRPAGRALAARFGAAFARLLAASGPRVEPLRRSLDGLWIAERRVRPGASVWLFDDLPLARIDEVAAESLGVTLRALLRRPAAAPLPTPLPTPQPIQPTDDRLDETLLAVARANGRVTPAARALGVHRNTVLYRLRRAAAERGVDPRRPADAIRLLREAETT